MIFIPIGTDQKRSRFPKLTLGLILANLAIYPLTLWLGLFSLTFAIPAYSEYVMVESRLMVKWFEGQGHPEPQRYYFQLRDNETRYLEVQKEFVEAMERGEVVEKDSREYREWKRLYEKAGRIEKRSQYYILGHVPADVRVLPLVTHMFVHGGVGHLFWNMYFLWLIGVGLEDIWGRKYYAGIYFVGGLCALLAHHLANLDSTMPMVGASGAISALMGAFMIRLYKVKLRYALFKFIFWVPAWIPLLFWFGRDVWSAIKGVDSGVAVWAHVGGYLFGMVAALVLIRTKAEDTFIAKALEEQDKKDEGKKLEKLEKKFGPIRPPEYEKAIKARKEGRFEDARELLLGVLQVLPNDIEVWEELNRIDIKIGVQENIAQDLSRLMAALVKQNKIEEALKWHAEFMRLTPRATIAGSWSYRIAAELARKGDWEAAVKEYYRFASYCQNDPLAPKAMFIAATNLAERLHSPQKASQLLSWIRKRYPDWMPDEVETHLKKLSSLSEPAVKIDIINE